MSLSGTSLDTGRGEISPFRASYSSLVSSNFSTRESSVYCPASDVRRKLSARRAFLYPEEPILTLIVIHSLTP